MRPSSPRSRRRSARASRTSPRPPPDPDQEISTIILSGGCARIAGIDQFLKERLRTDVEVNDPFQNIQVSDKKFDAQYISENASRAAVGIGLALRKAGDR